MEETTVSSGLKTSPSDPVKMWVLAESNGYLINFDPYQGAKNGKSARANDKTWGLGEIVVLSLLDVLPENVC